MKTFTREEIEKKICDIFSNFIINTVDMNDLMKDDLGLDSLDVFEIMMDVEKEFGIRIPEEEVVAAAGWTVSEVCDYVEEKIKEKKS